ncbi:RNA polymerase sigma factor, sigma-70 family [Nocardia amikacinitolerans]|uniref:RNA polymerase sigma factor n=1 Tax=Nocardia amikacinitolerans TaxID=756689 RepID=UPI000ACAE8C0|nr:RNA polymerase sigma factor [Nocardia amikacinitolerans]MCP2321485.1 RNA polymerase sigma factor, sigma-70 family [Nocardia amikacinitolerans]
MPEAAGRPDLEGLAGLAVAGDPAALEQLCRHLQDLVFRLSLRFTSDPEAAADATQEILILVVTHLSEFEGRSKLTTWVYSIATRYLLRTARGPIELSVAGPEPFADWIDRNLALAPPDRFDEAEFRVLAGEVRMACTYGMLLALTRDLRIAYLLGDLVGLPDTEGAEALGITRTAFRQRLARARRTMRTIIAERCGLIDRANPCRCDRQIESSIDYRILDPHAPVFSGLPGAQPPIAAGTLDQAAQQLDDATAIAEVYRSDPEFKAPQQVWQALQRACPALTG